MRNLPLLGMGIPAPQNGCYQSSRFMEAKLCSAWQQLAASKECFHTLKQDLLKGMAEANDIFNSMSIPLVRLVGLKMQQLAEQGRQTSVCLSPPLQSEILQAYSPPALCSDNRKRRCSEAWQSALSIPEDNLTVQAAHHVEEFSQLQKQQLRQLVGVVKMVEKLVRSQEETITEKFQDSESYLVNLQQSSLVNFKNLHQQVMDMRQQDSHLAYRLRVAEQSYQALMSLAVKIQESGIDKVRKNLLNVKIEVEGMVNELASSMCKPVVSFLKELRRDNDASMVVLKLQSLVAEMDHRVSSEFKTMATANDEYKAHVRKMDFQLQVCNREVEKMSQDGETLRTSLKERVEELEALKMVLAAEAAERQNYKAQLDNEVARAHRLEEELMRKERKLANAVKLLQATKLQISHQHSQMTDACTKSRELCSQLAVMEDKLNQTNIALESSLNGVADVAKDHEQLKCMQQQSQQISPEYSLPTHLWQNILKYLSDEMAEREFNFPDKAQLHEAVVLFTRHYGGQEYLRALVEAMKNAVSLFTKHLETKPKSGGMKDENPLSIDILLEQLEKNSIYWLSNIELSQNLLQPAQQTQDSREESCAVDVTAGLAPTQSCTSVAVCSDSSSKYLSNQLPTDVSLLSKTSGIFMQLVAAVAVATMSKSECTGSQLMSCRNGCGAPSQQQSKKLRSDVIQHGSGEVAQHDERKVKQLKRDVPLGSSSCEEGIAGNKRGIHSNLDVMDTGVVPFSARRGQTHNDAVNCEPQLQMQSYPAPASDLITHKTHNDAVNCEPQLQLQSYPAPASQHKMIERKEGSFKDNSSLVVIEGQKVCQSFSLQEGGSQSTLLLLDDEKGRPNGSSKELWQVLELGTDISCNKTMEHFCNGEATALKPSLTTRTNGHSSEPFLVLREDVQQPPRPFGKRASPRLLARRLVHSPYPHCK
ncbi:hypothetical protein GOP47_0017990 [Adiantum capillus-veneris]|uniref:Uncharacterized protein n=1 Tax=Adiantum capillus-veneris TaxID=13818 RepID=A0A9D4ZB39_ADICA|nr:hypothetical protein GOP47_0017990 [Adiantum capillus-veneris]